LEHKLIAQKTFRYQQIGELDKASHLLIVLHGYGQLAEFFIRKFNDVPENYLVIAPEGMHRFYLNGTSGRVGASWMTKEDRESDIRDNLIWLNQLLNELKAKKKFEKIILLGFSQGGATAARWYYSIKNEFNHLILWASVFPPDVEKPENSNNSENYFVIGNQDEFFSTEQQNQEISFYSNLGFQTQTFDGKHDIEIDCLNRILEDIN
jgi:predicted esterase